ncbi:MAG TPA: hypothetical protein VNV88_11670, partial [Candidatus Solibacter sp.]|nr:hypothetical protein [Candidatus Solibacter sp.]
TAKDAKAAKENQHLTTKEHEGKTQGHEGKARKSSQHEKNLTDSSTEDTKSHRGSGEEHQESSQLKKTFGNSNTGGKWLFWAVPLFLAIKTLQGFGFQIDGNSI